MSSTAKQGKELAKNTVIISIGKICTQAVGFLLLPLYTGILSTGDYGAVDLIITYTSLLIPIFTMQLEQAVFRFVIDVRGNDNEIKKVVSAIFTIGITFLLAFTVVYMAVAPFIPSRYKYFLIGNLLTTAYSLFMLQIARGLGKNGVYALGSFLNAASIVVLNIVFLVCFNMGAEGMMWSQIIASTVGGTYVLFATKAYRYIRLRKPSKQEAKTYLKYSAPLVPNQVSWWVLSASDRTVILWLMGVAYNGIYSIAGKFSNMYSVMYNIFNLSWTELLSVHFNDENRGKIFSELQDAVVKLLVCVYLLFISVMPFVFPIMINKKYDEAYYQIPVLMIGVFFSAMIGVMSAYYIADKKTTVIAATTMICAAINLVLDVILMPFIGLYAASIASAVAYFIMCVIRFIDVHKKYGINHSIKTIILFIVSSVVVFSCYYTRNMIVCAICLAGVAIMTFLLNRKILSSILKSAKKRFLNKA